MDFALGELGLEPEQFWSYTWPEYDSKRRGYWLRQEREWDRARHIMTMIHNVNCSKQSQMIRPEQVIKLSWDKERPQVQPPTEDEQNMMLLSAGFIVVDGKWVQRSLASN